MAKKFYLLTYGCQMNEADSLTIKELLLSDGYVETYAPEQADYLILNTCSIRENAVQRIVGRVNSFSALKSNNKNLKIAVGGCVTQLEGERFLEGAKKVDLIFGTSNFHRLSEYFDELEHTQGPLVRLLDPSVTQVENVCSGARAVSGPRFLPILRGCNNFCTYCVVPYTRGREVSRPVSVIISELEKLAANGCSDVTLVGQNVNSYRDGEVDFASLLRMAADTKISRLRFITSHPKDMSREVVETVAEHENLCPRFHLPMQSGANAVLERMNRRYTVEQYFSIADYIRQLLPDANLTTDIIVGFPGETEADFKATLQAMERVEFNSSFMFKYSPRPNTKAAEFKPEVPESIKQRRLEQVIAKQEELSLRQNQRFVSRTLDVLVEGQSKKRIDELKGRSKHGLLVIFAAEQRIIGQIVPVKITAAYANTLKGEVCYG